MKWIEQIRIFIGRIVLKNAHRQARKSSKVPEFTAIETIGIVYDATEQKNESDVQQFASQLREEGKKVHLIGFVNAKQIPFNRKMHIQSEYFCREMLSFFYLPDKAKIGRFIQTPFDLLIGLYQQEQLPLTALSSYTQARYKISSNQSDYLDVYDMMVDTGKDQSIRQLSQQIYHYLNVIQ